MQWPTFLESKFEEAGGTAKTSEKSSKDLLNKPTKNGINIDQNSIKKEAIMGRHLDIDFSWSLFDFRAQVDAKLVSKIAKY